MLVALLQRERNVSMERLATLFAQPIQFESRRRNLQRFLQLPQLNLKALWFPILTYWLKQHFHRGQDVYLVIDRTQWKHHNLLMVSVVYHKRAIPVFWHCLDHCGLSSLSEQQRVLRPVFALMKSYQCTVLGDREFHSVALADWLRQQGVKFVLRLPKSTTVKSHCDAEIERLDELLQFPGIACFEVQVQVTQQQGFGRFNLVTRWKRVYRHSKANQVWYLLTNLNDLDAALSSYAKRFSIEPMFKDFKTGGYNLENCRATGQRFLALVLLVSIAYTLTTEQGKRIRRKQIQHYIGRVKEPNRAQKRHSNFWIGLYGQLWIASMDLWFTWAEELMHLKPQKRRFFRQGLRAMSLIHSVL
ncbi:IS4 family transposase [Leptolyngbya sp. FACHB-711]|nr:IS4 family transposase [Leptolyngbya sp. FACHB-711]